MRVRYILGISLAIMLSVSGTVLAANNDSIFSDANNNEPSVQQAEIQAPILTDERPAIQISDDMNIPINLANSTEQVFESQSIKDNPIVGLINVEATNRGIGGDRILVKYSLKEKYQLYISETENHYASEDEYVKEAVSWYNPEDVELLTINGHTAVVENSKERKQLHLITDNHFYSIASPGNLNLELLIEVAEKIKTN